MKHHETLWQAIGLLPDEMLEEAASYTPARKKKKAMPLRLLAAAMASVIACCGIAWTAYTFLPPADLTGPAGTSAANPIVPSGPTESEITPVMGNIMLYTAASMVRLGEAILKTVAFTENLAAPENSSLLVVVDTASDSFSPETLSAQVNGIPYIPTNPASGQENTSSYTFTPAENQVIPATGGQCIITLSAGDSASAQVSLTPVKAESISSSNFDVGVTLTLAPVGQNLLFANLQNENWKKDLKKAASRSVYGLFQAETKDGELRYACSSVNLNGTGAEESNISLNNLITFGLRKGSNLLNTTSPRELQSLFSDIRSSAFEGDIFFHTFKYSLKVQQLRTEVEKKKIEANCLQTEKELQDLQQSLQSLEHTDSLSPEELESRKQELQKSIANVEKKLQNLHSQLEKLTVWVENYTSEWYDSLSTAYSLYRKKQRMTSSSLADDIILYPVLPEEMPEDFLEDGLYPSDREYQNLASLDWNRIYISLRYDSGLKTIPLMDVGETKAFDLILHADSLFECRLTSVTRTAKGFSFTTECTSPDPNIVEIQVEVRTYAPNAYISRRMETGTPLAIYVTQADLVYANPDGTPLAHITLD